VNLPAIRELSEDLFQNSRMPFGDHIEELRSHLWRAIVGFLVALIVGLLVGHRVGQFIAAPVEAALARYDTDQREQAEKDLQAGDPRFLAANQPKEISLLLQPEQLADALGLPATGSRPPVEVKVAIRPVELEMALAPAERLISRRLTLSTLGPTEAFMVYFKVSMYVGVVLASPWIFYQLWSFVAAGLYPHEKRAVNVYLPVSVALFLLGVALCEFVIIPVTLDYLLSFNAWMGIQPDLRLSEWLGFAILMPLVFGSAFQLPLVMLFLNRVGIAEPDLYRRHRKMALFVLAILAVVLTTSGDALSLLGLLVPLCVLYELGIVLCLFTRRPEIGDERIATDEHG
jgi:sec-independent protein translocase protein TatC